ncbi:hypothetical protein BACCELL_00269 [Bacteroides cellulosilyticus DSM 14838]|uniref:Uncharacterized protein n=1 Tax=Bacteroides cellulosilyticus DSM 14838 TaxID=537012 RepID=E2N7M5_9BACE|nr:hypothetical protein BACCELL_00269 [Bacteroides cellulosilyticus DSM 14838]
MHQGTSEVQTDGDVTLGRLRSCDWRDAQLSPFFVTVRCPGGGQADGGGEADDFTGICGVCQDVRIGRTGGGADGVEAVLIAGRLPA